jgi:probable rRNA maturation factor
MPKLNFFCEDIVFKLKKVQKIRKWIEQITVKEGFNIKEINYVFCSDKYLHKINLEYLQHDTYTDIITFDSSQQPQKLEGDVFVSIERILENCQTFEIAFEQELYRVIIHGILHLVGYKDKTPSQEKTMRRKENEALEVLSSIL